MEIRSDQSKPILRDSNSDDEYLAESQHESRIREQVENIIVDDSIFTESAYAGRTDPAANSGDEYG